MNKPKGKKNNYWPLLSRFNDSSHDANRQNGVRQNDVLPFCASRCVGDMEVAFSPNIFNLKTSPFKKSRQNFKKQLKMALKHFANLLLCQLDILPT